MDQPNSYPHYFPKVHVITVSTHKLLIKNIPTVMCCFKICNKKISLSTELVHEEVNNFKALSNKPETLQVEQ